MKAFLFIFLVCCAFSGIIAQQNYEWDYYGIRFTLADDFQEVVSNEEEFTAVGDGMSFSIIAFHDESLDKFEISAYTLEVAESLELDWVDDLNLINFNGFKGAYAEGVLNEEKIFLMGLIDPKSSTNFFVIITFYYDDENAINEAIRICRSIRKL
jgi:hypothetical protein